MEREVPWRSGTSTRSAKRHEVLSLLMPAAQTPETSFLNARCSATHRAKDQSLLTGTSPPRLASPSGSRHKSFVGHGLEAIPTAVEQLKKGVSARKLVVTT